jgi:ribosomal protein S18 acetylase RimI-like enzyme
VPLPILKIVHSPDAATLVRYMHQTEANWGSHFSEAQTLEVGMAWVNPALGEVNQANRVLDAALPAGVSPAAAVEEVRGHFAQRGARCRQWIMNPSAPIDRTAPLVEHLLGSGHRASHSDIMHLSRLPSLPDGAAAGLQVIPARASFRHTRQLLEGLWPDAPQAIEAEMAHLDDSHYDALLALRGGEAIAMAGVLAMGEVGRIDQVYVAEPHRRQKVASLMMSRVLEICARSLFKHILLAVMPENRPAVALYEKFGFRKIGQTVAYLAPDSAQARP